MNEDSLQGRYEEAVEAFESGGVQKAIAICNESLEENPDHLKTLHLASSLQLQAGKHALASELARRAVAVAPDSAFHHNALGLVLAEKGDRTKAIASLDRATKLQPEWVDPLLNKAVILLQLGHLQDSLATLEKVLVLNPDNVAALVSKCNILMKAGRIKDAISCVEKAASLAPDSLKLSRMRLGLLSYSQDHDSKDVSDEIRRMWRLTETGAGETSPQRHERHPSMTDKSPIRIGYVSADFRMHSVGQLIEPILQAHDTANFQIVLYSNHAEADELTRKLWTYNHEWRQISDLSDSEAVQMIRDDKIDILVDLSVHTEGERLGIFRLKPAPVQMTWLGYVTTTGLNQIDYIVSDKHVLPDNDDQYFVETPLRLPHMHFCYRPSDYPANVQPNVMKDRPVTFGSLNNIKKMNEHVLGVWAKILHAVPNSRLILKTRTLSNTLAESCIQNAFQDNGIQPDRLTLAGESTREEHLATYTAIDIALDPFPYNGTMTTLETLWMGVPVVSLKGDRWSSRVGAGILSTIGLSHLVGESEQDYVDIAVKLAHNRDMLRALKRSTRVALQSSPICNPRAFTRSLEALYKECWMNWCNG